MRTWMSAVAVITGLAMATGASAQERSFVLAADPALEPTGLLSYLVPRFALKHGIRPEVVYGDADADAAITRDNAPAPTGAADPSPAFYVEAPDAQSWSIRLFPERPNSENATRFRDWLTGEIGQRTVAGFAAAGEGNVAFLPGAIAVEAPLEIVVTGDATLGEKLAHFHCGRCHVVSDKNRMGGIGSAPSFAALRAIPGWDAKFRAFYQANPHPSFTQVDGVTEPFDPARPPHIAPVEITIDDIDAIFAFAAGIAPKDLGAPVEAR